MIIYSTVLKAYRLFDQISGRVFERRDVLFDGTKYESKCTANDINKKQASDGKYTNCCC